MLDYNILAQKPKITKYINNKPITFIDLTNKTYNNMFFSEGASAVYVDENYVARPDLISLAVYGDDKYADIICKVNGISNPFELNKGMILYIPGSSNLNQLFTGSNNENDLLEEFKHRKNTISGVEKTLSKLQRKNEDNTETIERKKKNLQKLKNERRSPADQTIEDKNYYIDKNLGVVIY